jgi:hypothetical protein
VNLNPPAQASAKFTVLKNKSVFYPRPPRWFACFFIAAAEPLRTEKTKAAAEPLRTEKEYSLNIRTMKELLKLWKADCEAEGFSTKDYIVVFQMVVLFSIFLAIL